MGIFRFGSRLALIFRNLNIRFSGGDWLWTPEYNLSCSHIAVPSPDIPSRVLVENQYWQALSPVIAHADPRNHVETVI